jgi:uncharacterized cupin superfamily protein
MSTENRGGGRGTGDQAVRRADREADAGAELCEVEHVGMVILGRAAVKMTDGTELVMGPGDVFAIPPGHDSWVVGDEPYVSLHLLGASDYAAR